MTYRESMLSRLQELWDMMPESRLGELVCNLAEGKIEGSEEEYEGTVYHAEDGYLSDEMDRILDEEKNEGDE